MTHRFSRSFQYSVRVVELFKTFVEPQVYVVFIGLQVGEILIRFENWSAPFKLLRYILHILVDQCADLLHNLPLYLWSGIDIFGHFFVHSLMD